MPSRILNSAHDSTRRGKLAEWTNANSLSVDRKVCPLQVSSNLCGSNSLPVQLLALLPQAGTFL